MAKVNVSLPQGTRDFGADVVRKRNYIFNTIKTVFELYGFEPLETPAMENLDTLMGKYGEEGDKLIFRVLDSGTSFTEEFFKELYTGLIEYIRDYNHQAEEFLKKEGLYIPGPFSIPLQETNPSIIARILNEIFTIKELREKYLPKLKAEISTKALKYDLTIPFARYVAMNHNQLTMPFKRYQVQPVWRADRPQKGRYREFYQCDADVVGSKSLLNELELTNIYATVFQKLGVEIEIRINSRKILGAFVQNIPEKANDFFVILDKLDKIGANQVEHEMQMKGINTNATDNIFLYNLFQNIISDYNKPQELRMSSHQLLINLSNTFQSFSTSNLGREGLNEVEYLINNFPWNSYSKVKIVFDPTLARGLNYYTGIIFEVKANNVQMGSIGGGGRYDDLTGLFGVPNIPGVGISFGVDRIYDVMEELKLFPEGVHTGTKVLFFNLGEDESKKAFELMQQLRSKGTSCELFHEQAKFDKQFKYAEKKQIPFIVIIGTKELETATCNVKNLQTGVQETISFDELLNKFS